MKGTHSINSPTLPSAKDIHWNNHHETVSQKISCLIMITQSFLKRYPVKSIIVIHKISKRYLIFLKDIHSNNSQLPLFQKILHSVMITYFIYQKISPLIIVTLGSPPKDRVIIIQDSRVVFKSRLML